MDRPQKIINIPEAVNKIKDGTTLGLSGFSYMNPPMTLVREIIRSGIKNLTLVSGPTSGIETDLLIGAGCVKKVVTACVAFENVAAIGPNFRRFAEQGKIEVWECDESIWHMALKAGSYGVPYMLWGGGIGTDLSKLNPALQEIEVDGKRWLKVPAIQPDVTILHAGIADSFGNVQFPPELFLGRKFCEEALARATKGEVIVQVEKVVPNEAIVANKERTILNNCWIVKSRFGAHPGGATGFYMPDLDHFREYVEAVEKERFQQYLEKYILNPKEPTTYLELVGINKLLSLEYY